MMTTTHRTVALAGALLATLLPACAPESAPPPAVAVGTAAPPPAATPRPAPRPAPPPPLTASDVLTQARAPFDACYARARAANPELGRTNIAITFSMTEEGKLLEVELKYRNRMDDAAKDCMRAAAEALVFPPSLYGKQVGTIEFAP
jgi:hypothetical protein